jgi:hypothetical protein
MNPESMTLKKRSVMVAEWKTQTSEGKSLPTKRTTEKTQKIKLDSIPGMDGDYNKARLFAAKEFFKSKVNLSLFLDNVAEFSTLSELEFLGLCQDASFTEVSKFMFVKHPVGKNHFFVRNTILSMLNDRGIEHTSSVKWKKQDLVEYGFEVLPRDELSDYFGFYKANNGGHKRQKS